MGHSVGYRVQVRITSDMDVRLTRMCRVRGCTVASIVRVALLYLPTKPIPETSLRAGNTSPRVSATIGAPARKRLRDAARRLGVPISAVVRHALACYLDRNDPALRHIDPLESSPYYLNP